MSGADVAGAPFKLTADRAVVTLPLGVLQAASVQFSPEPVEVLHEAARLASGPVLRISLLFDRKYWPSDMGFLRSATSPSGLLSVFATICSLDRRR